MQRLGDIPLDICNPSASSDLLLVRAEVVVVQVFSADNRDVPCHPFPEYFEMHTHRTTVSSSSSLELQYFLSRLGRKLWLSGQISLDVCIVLAF